jgi:hypothetical protein
MSLALIIRILILSQTTISPHLFPDFRYIQTVDETFYSSFDCNSDARILKFEPGKSISSICECLYYQAKT